MFVDIMTETVIGASFTDDHLSVEICVGDTALFCQGMMRRETSTVAGEKEYVPLKAGLIKRGSDDGKMTSLCQKSLHCIVVRCIDNAQNNARMSSMKIL